MLFCSKISFFSNSESTPDHRLRLRSRSSDNTADNARSRARQAAEDASEWSKTKLETLSIEVERQIAVLAKLFTRLVNGNFFPTPSLLLTKCF